jgi:hypothetical protein
MNKPTPDAAAPAPLNRDIKAIVNAGLGRRHAAERRFRWYGLIAISLGLAFVVLMFANIIGKGYPAFWQTYVQVPIKFDPAVLDPDGKPSYCLSMGGKRLGSSLTQAGVYCGLVFFQVANHSSTRRLSC